LKVSEITYVRPDADAIIAECKAFCKHFRMARSAKRQSELITAYYEGQEYASTMFNLAYIRYTLNTKDEFYKGEKDYMDEVLPKISVAENEVNKTILSSRYLKELETLFPPVYFKNLKIAAQAMDRKILSLSVKEGKLTSKYAELMSSLIIRYRGEKLTTAQIAKYNQNPRRDYRKGAMVAYGKVLKKNGKKLDAIYDKLVSVRTQMGKKMGYENYIPLGYLKMGRNCYTVEDIARLRANILKYIVPLVSKIRTKQAELLKIDRVAMYDREMYTKKEAKLALSGEEIFKAGIEMYADLAPETDELMRLMVDSDAFDVIAREGKWGGGYCTELPAYRLPFILANFNGSLDDIGTLTHEFGHALAAYQAFKLPYPMLRQGSMETCEVHSMSMELFTYPYMQAFFGKTVEEYYTNHLSSAVCFLPYGTLVDAFQHEVYAHPEYTPAQRNAVWLTLQKQFMPDVDPENLPAFSEGRWWQRQMHIYETPFYYVDYVIAQLTALQFYALSKTDYKKAFETYMTFLKKGGTEDYRSLMKSAGLSDPFEEETFPAVVKAVEEALGL
jgi:M3 family oligoendopeptidase